MLIPSYMVKPISIISENQSKSKHFPNYLQTYVLVLERAVALQKNCKTFLNNLQKKRTLKRLKETL